MPSLKSTLKTVRAMGARGAVFLLIYEDGKAEWFPGRYIADGVWVVGERLAKELRPARIRAVVIQPPEVKPVTVRDGRRQYPLFVADEASSILLDEKTFAVLWETVSGKRPEPIKAKSLLEKLMAGDGKVSVRPEELRGRFRLARRFFLRLRGDGVELEEEKVPVLTTIREHGVARISELLGIAASTSLANDVVSEVQPELALFFSKLGARELLDYMKVILMPVAVGIGLYIVFMGLYNLARMMGWAP